MNPDANTQRTIAAIVTYNPDLPRLEANVEAVAPQVCHVVIVDNGSHNQLHIEKLCTKYENVVLIRNTTNRGIATALNQCAKWAREYSADLLLTLDQDSVPAPHLVTALVPHVSKTTPMVTPYIVDRNKMSVEEYESQSLPLVEHFSNAARKGAITSGAIIALAALEEVGGFDDRLFIDYVDYDLNRRLLLAGYQISRVNSTYLLHEVGHASRTWLVTPRRTLDGHWRIERFYKFGHSPQRCFYKARNRVIYTRRYGFSRQTWFEGIFQIPLQIVLTLLFETERRAKMKQYARGAWDGIRCEVEPYNRSKNLTSN